MAFQETQFPADISEGSVGGPEYKTIVVAAESGAEQRISLWPRGRLRWDVSKGVQKAAQQAALITFFRACAGRAIGFRFKDWLDYTCLLEPITNAGTTTLQLQKTYVVGTASEVRKITKPITGTSPTWPYTGIHLYQAGGLLTSGYTVDYTTGLVTLAVAAPGSVFTWSGEFDVACRFDVDTMKHSLHDGYTEWDGILVVELPN